MTLEQFLELVRSGEVDLWIRRYPDPEEVKQRMMDPTFTDETITRLQVELYVGHRSDKGKLFELFQVVNTHPLEIYLLLNRGDAQVCMVPSEHWQSYRKIEEDEETYYRCDPCADARDTMIEGTLELPKELDTPTKVLDFQKHQKGKRES